jgi:deoxyribonuclease-1
MTKFYFSVLIASCLTVFTASSYADKPYSFSKAKRVLASVYEGNHSSTFYCACDFSYQGKKLKPDLASCGYKVRKQDKRAKRIEWEHIVPAWNFGHQMQCWQNGGRKACKKEAQFKLMEGDMHNLVPAIGEVNGDRSNYRFSDWNGVPHQYGKCGMLVDFKARKVQPTDQSKGAIARAYLYMSQQYGLDLSKQDLRVFNAWHKQHPPTDWECKKGAMIDAKQAGKNTLLALSCKK